MVDPEGIVHNLGSLYPRGPSGLTTLPDGSVVAMDELGVDKVSPQGFQTLVSFPTTAKVSYLGITGFSPNGIAVGANGSIYLDTFDGNGFADQVRVGDDHRGRIRNSVLALVGSPPRSGPATRG